MSAIVYDLRAERARRELAKIYNVPVRKVQQVEKGLLSFYIYFDQASGFDTPFILTAISDGEVMFEADGKLTPDEIKKELELVKESYINEYYPPAQYHNGIPYVEDETSHNINDLEMLKSMMGKFKSLDDLPPTVASKVLEDLFKPKHE